MHLTELRTFLAIIDSGSLIKAAKRLNVTQSTVTARLKSLEAELGQTLINRQKSGASLTAAGTRLQRYANTISDLWRQAKQETALPDAVKSVCNIGCEPDLWPDVGERLFEFIRTQVPNSAVSISLGNQNDLTSWLNDGLIDMSLSYDFNASQRQEIFPIFEDELILVSTDAGSPIRFDPNYVLIEAGEDFGRQHAEIYSDAGTAKVSFNNAQMGMEFLLREGGSAYVPKRIAAENIDAGQLFVLTEGTVFQRQAFLTVNKSARSTWTWFNDFVGEISSSNDVD